MKTKIEYATDSWNPVVGCTKISPGCDHCYAERMARRVKGIAEKKKIIRGSAYNYSKCVDSNGWTGVITCSSFELDKINHWTKKPRRIFVCTMGDLFHVNTPEWFIRDVIRESAKNVMHKYLFLTKRPGRMSEIFSRILKGNIMPDNFWLGTTTENQITFNFRISKLANAPAKVRWISVEPMLGPVDISAWAGSINWVVCGGESGSGARPINPDWVRALRNQCIEFNIPFFFKQWGEWGPNFYFRDTKKPGIKKANVVSFGEIGNINTVYKQGKKKAGNLLDGKKWEAYPNGN